MTWWVELPAALWRLLDEHGQVAAFVLLFLEEAGVPPLIPGDVLMILVGIRVGEGKLRLLEVLVLLELATVLGGSVLYWISAWGGHALVLRLGSYVGADPERLRVAAASLERHGARTVILGRLLPGLSMLTTVACGVLEFPFRRFLPALALGGLLRNAVFVLLGYLFGPPILAVVAGLHLPLELLASLALFAGLAIWIARAARTELDLTGRPQTLVGRLHTGALAGLLGAIESALLVNVMLHLFGLINDPVPGTALKASGLLNVEDGPILMLLVAPAFLIAPTVWGVAYGAWGVGVLRGPQWLRGVIFAGAPLAASLLIVLPLVGAGFFGQRLGAGAIPAIGESLRHLVYGLVLGSMFPRLSRREPASSPRAAGASLGTVDHEPGDQSTE